MSKRIVKENNDYFLIYNRYKNIALNCFTWNNLPDNLLSRHMEKALYSYGACVLKEEHGGFVILGCTETGEMNIMEEPTSYIATGYGYSKKVTSNSNAICWNNDLRIPTHMFVERYANKMLEVEKAIETNVKQQKFPWLISTTKNNEFSMKNLYKKIESGEPIIFGSKEIDTDTIRAFNTNTPYVIDKLNAYKYELEREILTFFGLNNNFEKKERLLTDEINSNNDYIESNVDLMLKCREEFCEVVNNLYGLNITVEKKYKLQTMEQEVENIE